MCPLYITSGRAAEQTPPPTVPVSYQRGSRRLVLPRTSCNIIRLIRLGILSDLVTFKIFGYISITVPMSLMRATFLQQLILLD
jgi:hypothetical protein